MPRGPGKKENYNLDYNRFNSLDDEDEEVKTTKKEVSADEADAAAGMPDMRDMLRSMPPELQEAFHLMQIAKQNGDEVAQQRASELAIAAVQKGSPEVQAAFMESVGQQMPEIKGALSEEIGGINKKGVEAKDVLQGLQKHAASAAYSKKEAEKEQLNISNLREQMLQGQEATRREMEALKKQQEMLENVRTPEDFQKFMQAEGLTQEDLQRIFSGDTKFMEDKVNASVEKTISSNGAEKSSKESADALKKVDDLHNTLFGDDTPIEEEPAKPAKPERKMEKPKEPEVIIPMYRLQYSKDESGSYTSVELKCTLPGVADMSVIDLDVSEKHLRLSTRAPAPKYAVNAGPFPVHIDPNGARAKYSKKREELSISVPAKTA